ncbi:hypothetical protein MKW92_008415 [Papaver armeniacum]|nr:hypothetical protein MKW92_008415 [Papaver armeniacum]
MLSQLKFTTHKIKRPTIGNSTCSLSSSALKIKHFFLYEVQHALLKEYFLHSNQWIHLTYIKFSINEVSRKGSTNEELGFSRESIFIRGFDTSFGIDQCHSLIFNKNVKSATWRNGYDLCQQFYHLDAFPKALAMNGNKLGDYPLTIEDATPLNLNVRGTGGRDVSYGGLFGPYGGSTYVHRFLLQSDRGYGRAGLGSVGSPYRHPSGKKIKFDYDELEGEETGQGACTQSTV